MKSSESSYVSNRSGKLPRTRPSNNLFHPIKYAHHPGIRVSRSAATVLLQASPPDSQHHSSWNSEIGQKSSAISRALQHMIWRDRNCIVLRNPHSEYPSDRRPKIRSCIVSSLEPRPTPLQAQSGCHSLLRSLLDQLHNSYHNRLLESAACRLSHPPSAGSLNIVRIRGHFSSLAPPQLYKPT